RLHALKVSRVCGRAKGPSPRGPLPPGAAPLADDLIIAKDQGNFRGRGLGAVGTVHRIALDVFGKLPADRALFGLVWIGGTHDVAVAPDRILSLKHLHDDWPRGHEPDEIAVERARLVYQVEFLGLGLGPADPLLGADAQPCGLDEGVDGPCLVASGGVRLDDGQGTLDRHPRLPASDFAGPARAYSAIRAPSSSRRALATGVLPLPCRSLSSPAPLTLDPQLS